MLTVTSPRPLSARRKRAAAKPAMHAVAVWQVMAIWDGGWSGRD